jgi:hypothetical protein
MIINITGTSGSGKSTIVRDVMKRYSIVQPEHTEGRRQPISYYCEKDEFNKGLVVIGHYETPCGGCDTIKTPDEVQRQIIGAHEMGCHVLYEGIIIQDDTKRRIALHKAGYPFAVILLTTTLDVCLAGIQARRDARGDARPLDPSNTQERMERQITRARKLRAAGVTVHEFSRQQALEFCLKEFGFND